MRCREAVVHGVGRDRAIEETEVDPPKRGGAPGRPHGDLANLGTRLAGRSGTIVAKAVAPFPRMSADVNLSELTPWSTEITGTVFGPLNPRFDIRDPFSMHGAGTLEPGELVTTTSPPKDIDMGCQAMRDGENIRGVVEHAA